MVLAGWRRKLSGLGGCLPLGPACLGCWSHGGPHDCAEPPLAPVGGRLLDPWGRLPARFWPLLPPAGLVPLEVLCVFICSAPHCRASPCQAVF